MRLQYTTITAEYKPTGARLFDGNPFIEALPAMEATKNQILDRLKNDPTPPTQSDRRKSELVRLVEANVVAGIVYPFAEYKRAGSDLTTNLREAYVARNPLSVEDRRRRAAIATSDSQGVPFPSNWRSTAKGQTLLGISGSGKTTFAEAFSLKYQIVIEHKEYKGESLKCRQIPWVTLRTPPDATLKSLCLQFFRCIDEILGNTSYEKEAQAVRSISRMVMLMSKVATAVSLGAIFVDEVQNLRAARSQQAEFMLNLFSEIIEKAGLTLVIAGTPAVEEIINKSVRNLRKLNSGGEAHFGTMRLKDPEFDAFCDKYWEYQYVKRPKKLTPEIRKAWHRAGAGNPAFTAMAFLLAQRNEIGGRETLDDMAFERASKVNMAILEPAITALRSGQRSLLMEYDDLLFKRGCTELCKLIEWKNTGYESTPPEKGETGEFDDMAEKDAPPTPVRKTRGTRKSKEASDQIDLPFENPLIR